MPAKVTMSTRLELPTKDTHHQVPEIKVTVKLRDHQLLVNVRTARGGDLEQEYKET